MTTQQFISYYTTHTNEASHAQSFLRDLLALLGATDPSTLITFEKQVVIDGNTKRIDAYLPDTRALIEMKSANINLDKPALQSDNTLLTPYGQAKRYADALGYNDRPRWILTSNFLSIEIHDMADPNLPPETITLDELTTQLHRLRFLVDNQATHISREETVSLQAGKIIASIYDLLHSQYINPDDPDTLHQLNKLCVRLVFLLYAEDTDILPRRQMFGDYLRHHTTDARDALIRLFHTLATPIPQRDPYIDTDLQQWPYVNGGLFEGDVLIPRLTSQIVEQLILQASERFDWSPISPTIFGALFESTLNPQTRRSGGMHYTSIRNIHRLIDPLFLDNLQQQLHSAQLITNTAQRTRALQQLQAHIASLQFLDPACGSGNFLTETYLSLRRLENQIISLLIADNPDTLPIIHVSIDQMNGIEINDFATTVATTALWIAESQMLRQTALITNAPCHYLPLKTYTGITHANALRINWQSLNPKPFNFIIGNPPFVGARLMSKEQKDDLLDIFGPQWKNVGNIDYVGGWYKKAADLIRRSNTRCAFVSTNSITQGDQAACLWQPIISDGIKIDFAWRTFRWDSEAAIKAHVHVVIVAFSSCPLQEPKRIFTAGKDDDVHTLQATNINSYLLDAPDIFIQSRNKPLCNVPEIGIGNKPIDGGFYLFKVDEKKEFVKHEPNSEKYFRLWYGADEFINNRPRYCLWLGDCTPSEIKNMPHCYERVKAVREYRLKSTSPGTVKLADKPTRFHVENMPKSNFILIPCHSSENRQYIPIGFMNAETIASNAVQIIPNATLYHFGILTSSIHNAWMRAVCGRLKSDYRYSKDIVYNNFPWPDADADATRRIEATAQAILDARAAHPDDSLAALYDPLLMPPDLRAAHRDNDHAVFQAYHLPPTTPESQIVAFLMSQYQHLTRPHK